MSALSFCFESNQVRVLGTIVNPLFIALDICKALGFTNHRKAISDHVDPEDISKMEITTNGGKQEVNCVNESGMYALIFGSKLPSAKRFKKWVTSEVLPAIRKNGQYSATEESSEVVPLTPRQQYKIQRAVAERAKGSHVHFNTIYKAIKIYFKVAKYDQIPASRFDECINFIQTVDLRIPEVLSDQPVEFPKPQLPYCPHCVLRPVPKGGVILDQYGAEKLLGFVYEFKYLHRKQLEAFHALLVSVRSPLAGAFYETMNSWAVSNVESLLERNGYSVKDLDCYRHFIGVTA